MIEVLQEINKWEQGTLFKYSIIGTIIMMLLFLIFIWIVKKIAIRYIKKKHVTNDRFLIRTLRIILNVLLIYSCLSLLTPFDNVLGKIWGSAGILAVVIGLDAQESMGNFINGILITSFKPFKIGDLVKVNNGEFEGYVIDISLRDTVIRTYENTNIIIPNSVMNKAILENVSLSNKAKGNFLFLNIAYDSDLEKAMHIMQQEVMHHPHYIDARSEDEIKEGVDPVIIRFTSFNDSSISLRANVYSKNSAQGFAMLSDLRFSIKAKFDKEGIEFPFPQRTITVKKQKK